MHRSLLKFENAIKSEKTRILYKYHLDNFLKFTKIKDADGLLQLKDSFLQELLEDYLFHLKKSISPNSLNPPFAALQLFFSMNDKTLNFKKIRKMFPATVKHAGNEYWLTADIQKMLDITKSKRMRAIIHLLNSTGCRIGVIEELKLRHVTEIEDCKAIKFYPGTNEEYVGFLTPESSRILDDYLAKRKTDGEILGPESPLFRQSYRIGSAKVKQLTVNSLTKSFVHLLHQAGLNRTREGRRHNISRFHGFRKRFNTILKDNAIGNIALKEKLMGHRGVFALDGRYHNPDVRTLFEEFKKHIPNLTINDSEKQRLEIDAKNKRISELEAERKINESMVRWFQRYKDAHPEEFKDN